MKKVCIIGHFGFGHEMLNGQTIKTKILTKTLEDHFGEDEVLKIDSRGGLKTLLKAPFQVIKALHTSRNVVMLPAHNGVRVYAPLMAVLGLFRKKTKVHYAVIGGWLPKLLENKPILKRSLKQFAGIYVETRTMKKALEEKGFTNIELMLNCKELEILQPKQMPMVEKPYKLCTFSRVVQEKGMEDAIDVIRTINEERGQTIYTLDIYGPVDPGQTQWFEDLKQSFPEYVKYGGSVPFDQSVEVLKDYFALLFPTRFFTEGVPGTIIDAYAAGLPVISAKWESFADVVDDGVTGYGYEFGNNEAFQKLLERFADDPKQITGLKENCLRRAVEYLPENALGSLIRKMEG